MRDIDERFDPENPQDDGYKPLSLSIQVQTWIFVYVLALLRVNAKLAYTVRFCQVISGQQLPKVNIKEGSIIDPLVRVEIHGVPLDQAKQETRYLDNNGQSKRIGRSCV